MPSKKTRERAAEDKREGKSPSTQAGEFVREEIHHVREGKHGARSAKQVIAIGLSEAARKHHKPSRARSRASRTALEHEGSAAASPVALSRHAHAVARPKAAASRRAVAKKKKKKKKKKKANG